MGLEWKQQKHKQQQKIAPMNLFEYLKLSKHDEWLQINIFVIIQMCLFIFFNLKGSLIFTVC